MTARLSRALDGVKLILTINHRFLLFSSLPLDPSPNFAEVTSASKYLSGDITQPILANYGTTNLMTILNEFGSIWVLRSYANTVSNRLPNKALPRLRAL